MDYIETYKQMGYSNKLIEYEIVKEYLLEEEDLYYKEIRKNEDLKNVPQYVIVLVNKKLKERLELFQNLRERIQDKIIQAKKDENKV